MFATYGMSDILYSDKGYNFESSILRQTLEAFGIKKSWTTAYHSQEMALLSVLISPCFKCFAFMLMIMLSGSDTCHLFYLHIALLCRLLQE